MQRSILYVQQGSPSPPCPFRAPEFLVFTGKTPDQLPACRRNVPAAGWPVGWPVPWAKGSRLDCPAANDERRLEALPAIAAAPLKLTVPYPSLSEIRQE